jgi:primosomal protein N' (replication factor Y) (superfamily II helicase)
MDEEFAQRQSLGYPPFGRMLLLRLWGTSLDRVRAAAQEAAEALAGPMASVGVRVLGPAPAPVARVKSRYRYQILLKMPPRFPVGDVLPGLLQAVRDRVAKGGVRMEADVDPYHMMV